MEVKTTSTETLTYWKDRSTLLEKDLNSVKSRCESLELELSSKKSEIQSMKIALNYSDTFTMRRETELREEIERLKKQSTKKTQKKKNKEKVLIEEITSKTIYIDDLVCKVQNLHQSLQYCRDDLSKYQHEYHEARYWLEIEKEHKEKYKQCLEVTEEHLETAKSNFQILNQQLEVFKGEKDKAVKILIEKIQDRACKEIDEIRKNHLEERKKFEKEQAEKLEKTILFNSETLKNIKIFTDDKIKDLRIYYENRIKRLINELCTDEGKHTIQTNKLHLKISELLNQNHVLSQINEFLIEKVDLKVEETKELQFKLKELEEQQTSLDQYEKIDKSLNRIELDSLKVKFEDTKSQIISDYERQMKILQDHNQIALKSIQDRHKSQLEKIHVESGELNNKDKQKYELQIDFLLNKIETLETQKTLLESRTIEKIETDNHELIDKNLQLSEEILKLQQKIESIGKETEEKLRKEFVLKLKQKLLTRHKKYQELLRQNDLMYSTRVNSLNLMCDKKIEENKKLAKQEYEASEAQYLQKLANLEDLLKKTINENAARAKVLTDKIDDQKFEIDIINRQNFQKQLLINDMEEEFKTRVVFLQNQLTETELLLERVEKECNESKEKTQKDYANRFAEAQKKHEKEKNDLIESFEKERNNLDLLHTEKISKAKTKYKTGIENLNNTLGSTIENLTYKLNYKSKILKQQKSEISGLKTQIRYLDNSSRMFTASSKSPVSNQKFQFDSAKRSTFLRPGSLIQYKKT